MFKKILIANRGEIAVRILRACREMGIQTVAIHSTIDHDAMHVRLADESICVGPAPSKDSYMNIPAILSAASITGADAIHPGLGFLSENHEFAQMVEEHGFTFIGPTPDHIRVMGDKVLAKKAVSALGIPVVPGSDGSLSSFGEAADFAKKIGYPVLIKASGGGGGKGMQVVECESNLAEALSIAKSEGKAHFGNADVFMEKYLITPRHIEVQILADSYGNVVHLGERDCSIQRRHQKIWEEATSPAITPAIRAELGNIVTDAIKKLGYRGVGTLEFLYENGAFYFIEMNTRLQVEHPITEMVTGINLVSEQIRMAFGDRLPYTQDQIKFKGHAIECRINAENPHTFFPSPGLVTSYHAPGGPGVRVDSHLYAGYRVPPTYDSLVSKLIVYGDTRQECLNRLRGTLKEYVIAGIQTNIPLHLRLLDTPEMQSGDYHIHWLEAYLKKAEDAELNSAA